jgi:16S rRNA (uracil1498-N3)-methyltransferase
MATPPRLFTDTELHRGQTIEPTATQTHYLTSVMRRVAGNEIVLFNGRDGEWVARLNLAGRGCQLEVASQSRPQAPEPDIWLAFAPLKRQATDLVVQKATELGVAALLPVTTQRTQTERINLLRLRAIAIEAAEQSERLSVPTIHAPQDLMSLAQQWPAGRALFLAVERREGPSLTAHAAPCALLIGPEGGFHPTELDALCAHPFVHPISLGPRILRAETAAIVGLALLLLSA